MSPIITQQRKKQQKLIIVLGLVVIVTLSVFYFGVIRRGGEKGPTITGGTSETKSLLQATKEIKLNTEIFQNARFRALTPYKKLPQDIETGRENPFLPY